MPKVVAPSLANAFAAAIVKYPDERSNWNKLSFQLGSLLPDSMLRWSIQSMGTLDLAVRALEDEALPVDETGNDLEFSSMDLHVVLSEMWVGGVYEVTRLLKDRGLVEGDAFFKLAHDFELVRVPIEKHELPKERKLKSPIALSRQPPNNDGKDVYIYDRLDPKRAHIIPKALSERGSLMWHVFDHLADKSWWLERRPLSERLLSLDATQSVGAGA
jgi:hypothetical protein